jgi:hypothetical protein
MDYDYRPHAWAGILFLVVIVISSVIAVSRRKITLAHLGQVIGWDVLALVCFLGVVGSAGPPNRTWIGLVLWSALLLSWLRFGLLALKGMKAAPAAENDGNG